VAYGQNFPRYPKIKSLRRLLAVKGITVTRTMRPFPIRNISFNYSQRINKSHAASGSRISLAGPKD